MPVGLVLPAPTHVEATEPEETGTMGPPAPTVRKPPPQGQRKGWIPRSQADFGGGGAFPLLHRTLQERS